MLGKKLLFIAQERKKEGRSLEIAEKKTCASPDLKIVRKCYVTGSKSNYLSEKGKVTVYRLPSDPQ